MPASAQEAVAAQQADAVLRAGAVAAAAQSGEAPSEELAKAAAKKSGHAIEVTSLRDERRDVFANADGSFSAREYTQPVRTQRGEDWVPVDATLVDNGDGTWSPKAATVDLEFSGGGNGPFARMSRIGREYALTWPGGALPTPKVEADTATYAEVLPGVDLVVRAGIEGFSHYFVVKTAEAAANPELDTLELGLSTKGLTVKETPGGAVQAVDSAVGGTVFESGSASMWDSTAPVPPARAAAAQDTGPRAVHPRPALDAADGGRKARVGIDVAKGKLTLKPDLKLLRGKNTGYPVVIDPTPRTTGTTAWTGVMSGMPNEQDWKYSGDAGVGLCPVDQTPASCSGIGVRRLLFSFPMGFYKGKQILSSTFSARVAKVYWNDYRAEPIDLYRVGGANYTVTESSNYSNTSGDWTNQLLRVNQKIVPTTCGSQANLHFSNGAVLTDVRAAAAGGWNTMSFGLRAGDETAYAGWKRICGNAYLSITYNTPPLQVANATMSSNPGDRCVTDPAQAPYVDGLPQLRAEARDPDHTATSSDPVKMQYQVFYRDAANVEKSYFAETGYKAPNAGTHFTHQVTAPPAPTGPAMYYPTTKMVYQRSTPTAGPNTAQIPFDATGRKVLVGDWNGDGLDTLGTYDPATRTFALRDNNAGPDKIDFAFGSAGDLPVVGDWNGDGVDTVGVWRPSSHMFYLNNEHTNSVADVSFVYGADGMTPLVGDWNGDGLDTVGMYYGAISRFYIRNFNSAGGNSYEIHYGSVGDQPVVGDWNGDGTDSTGVWRPSSHIYYLNNEHANNVADVSFVYGADGMTALAGKWVSGIPENTTISWQARAFDGDAWGPWSSANGAGRCVVRRDSTIPARPIVTGTPYKDDNQWRDGIGGMGVFRIAPADKDVASFRYSFDGAPPTTRVALSGLMLTWTPTWAGRHTLWVESVDGAGHTSARTTYSFLVASGRIAQWSLADPEGSTEALDEVGSSPAHPGTGVTFQVAGRGGMSDPVARFDGTSLAYLTTADEQAPAEDASVVDTTLGFSVSAWVKPAALDRDMTVLSQDGTDQAGFVLGYDAATKSWAFSAPDADGTANTRYAARVDADAAAVDKWVHLTGVFDTKSTAVPQLRLYVDDGDPATPTATATAERSTSWAATGAFQIGRAKIDGTYGAPFAGDMSQVRVYNRPVTTGEIAEFQTVRPARKAYWDFETDAVDGKVPNTETTGAPLALYDEAKIYRRLAHRDPVALSGNGHMVLDGVNDHAYTSAPVVGGDKSFTVAARVRLTNVDSTTTQTILSLPGQNTDRLAVRYDGATKRFKLTLTAGDSATAKTTELANADALPSATGSGNHLAVVYDAVTRNLRLYVDGGEPVQVTVEDPAGWASTGGLQVGRSGKAGQYLSGAVDEVRAYAGALSPTVISMLNNVTPEPNL
ncbi:LamG domain-containing protein [Streptomyces sp. NPDC126499]|uniref:LamG domain-containing protein n=1 Tax=Streptomyces sp. NPDC126499 TaxID=3155314 RepID=UPI00331FDE6B